MIRRSFLATACAFILAPAAFAGDTVNYTEGLIENALADGKTVFVDFATDWCSTCARQERVIGQLRSENPAYNENILFVRVDWDKFSTAPISVMNNIPRRSTLVVFSGEEELGRIVAGTGKAEIKALLDTALNAASS